MDHTFDNIFDLKYSKYSEHNLKTPVGKFEQLNNLNNLIYTGDFCTQNNLTRKRYNSFYLKELHDFQKNIARILKSNTPMYPFIDTEEVMYSDMKFLVYAADMVEVILIYNYNYFIYF